MKINVIKLKINAQLNPLDWQY